MQRVSSNLTLFFKLFIPTVWIVFFTVFTITLFVSNEQQIPFLTSPSFKYPFLGAYLFFFMLIYLTLIQLKRVEMDKDFYYVSNYFKTYKLIYNDIDKITKTPIGRLMVVTFKLKAKGSFGKKITFLASKNLYEIFLNENPEVAEQLADLSSES